MRIAFIGDIVGQPGRKMVQDYLTKIKEEYEVDFVIANYENASHGFGLTPKNANELVSYGIDLMSGGNHAPEMLPAPTTTTLGIKKILFRFLKLMSFCVLIIILMVFREPDVRFMMWRVSSWQY